MRKRDNPFILPPMVAVFYYLAYIMPHKKPPEDLKIAKKKIKKLSLPEWDRQRRWRFAHSLASIDSVPANGARL
jgi:hypothetical protein